MRSQDIDAYFWEEALLEEGRVPEAHRQVSAAEARAIAADAYARLMPPDLAAASRPPDVAVDLSLDGYSQYDLLDHRITLGCPIPLHIAHESAHAALATLCPPGRLGGDLTGHGPVFAGAVSFLWEQWEWQPADVIGRMARVCGVEVVPWADTLGASGYCRA